MAIIPAGPAQAETQVINSRFIAQIAPTATVEEARAAIAAVRTALPAARHHVYAYIVGPQGAIEGMNDDGEPAGTAGRPVLAVLRGSGLEEVTLVVTRYFGGTLLGRGGLVRAYGDAARAVLAVVPRVEKIPQQVLVVTVPYPLYELTRRLAAAHAGAILAEEFAAAVVLQIQVPAAEALAFAAAVQESTAGQAQIVQHPKLNI